MASTIAWEEGTWADVEYKAEMLNLACVDRGSFGGYMNAGLNGWINIVLLGTKVGGGGKTGVEMSLGSKDDVGAVESS